MLFSGIFLEHLYNIFLLIDLILKNICWVLKMQKIFWITINTWRDRLINSVGIVPLNHARLRICTVVQVVVVLNLTFRKYFCGNFHSSAADRNNMEDQLITKKCVKKPLKSPYFLEVLQILKEYLPFVRIYMVQTPRR